jgi:hypothetical protein
MRRFTLFGTVLLSLLATLLAFCSVVLAQDRLQEIFPGSEVSWEKRFDGKIRNFQVAKESGHVVVSSTESDGIYIYRLDKTGRQLWKKKLTSSKQGGATISGNGETILASVGTGVAHWHHYYVFDSDGNLLWNRRLKGQFYLSPKGGYLAYQNTTGSDDGYTRLRVLDRFGNELWEKYPPLFQKGRFLNRFITENEMLVLHTVRDTEDQAHRKLLYVEIPSLDVKWEYEIPTPIWVINFSIHSTSCRGNSIVFSARGWDSPKDPTYILSFKKDGTLAWKREDIEYADWVRLTPDTKYVLVYEHTAFYVLSNDTGETLLRHEMEDGFDFLSFFSFIDRQVILSGYARSPGKKISYICEIDKNWSVKGEEEETGIMRGYFLSEDGSFNLVREFFVDALSGLRVIKMKGGLER